MEDQIDKVGYFTQYYDHLRDRIEKDLELNNVYAEMMGYIIELTEKLRCNISLLNKLGYKAVTIEEEVEIIDVDEDAFNMKSVDRKMSMEEKIFNEKTSEEEKNFNEKISGDEKKLEDFISIIGAKVVVVDELTAKNQLVVYPAQQDKTMRRRVESDSNYFNYLIVKNANGDEVVPIKRKNIGYNGSTSSDDNDFFNSRMNVEKELVTKYDSLEYKEDNKVMLIEEQKNEDTVKKEEGEGSKNNNTVEEMKVEGKSSKSNNKYNLFDKVVINKYNRLKEDYNKLYENKKRHRAIDEVKLNVEQKININNIINMKIDNIGGKVMAQIINILVFDNVKSLEELLQHKIKGLGEKKKELLRKIFI